MAAFLREAMQPDGDPTGALGIEFGRSLGEEISHTDAAPNTRFNPAVTFANAPKHPSLAAISKP
ncbi:hypothetical protein [Thiobacillus denitrificans]|nr:hypothetical protein [Thiobacillus denitrificans]